MMKKMVIAFSLLLLVPLVWAQGNPARPDKGQRQAARRDMQKEQKPVEPAARDSQAQRRADLRAALLAKRPPEQQPQQSENNKHLTPSERMELRQQLRQQQMERQGKGG